MSATNRSKRGGDGVDFFETPAWCVDLLLDRVSLPMGGEWLEPSAGDGAIIRAVRRVRPDVKWVAVESDGRRWRELDLLGVRVRPLDFLSLSPARVRWQVCLGNPPYRDAEGFVRQGLKQADEVVFLLRLGFLAGQKRAALYREHGTPDVYVLPRRPSFTGRSTDSADYAWMRWKADGSQEGRVVRLDSPAEVAT